MLLQPGNVWEAYGYLVEAGGREARLLPEPRLIKLSQLTPLQVPCPESAAGVGLVRYHPDSNFEASSSSTSFKQCRIVGKISDSTTTSARSTSWSQYQVPQHCPPGQLKVLPTSTKAEVPSALLSATSMSRLAASEQHRCLSVPVPTGRVCRVCPPAHPAALSPLPKTTGKQRLIRLYLYRWARAIQTGGWGMHIVI